VPAVEVNNLNFTYDTGSVIKEQLEPALKNLSLTLQRGARVLLVGDNGAGKSTLLRIIGGRHMHERDAVKVFGRPAFYDTALNMRRTLLQGSWGERTVAFIGHGVAYQADIPVKEMSAYLQRKYPERRDELYRLLGVDPEWRMHRVSQGQRRRVQLLLGLLHPFELLLLDELTADLDLCTRIDLLAYLRRESEERGACIVYATHVFDGMGDWPTHMAYISDGAFKRCCSVDDIPEIDAAKGGSGVDLASLGGGHRVATVLERWMRADREEKLAALRVKQAAAGAISLSDNSKRSADAMDADSDGENSASSSSSNGAGKDFVVVPSDGVAEERDRSGRQADGTSAGWLPGRFAQGYV